MDVQHALNVVGLFLNTMATALIAFFTYAEEPLIGEVQAIGDQQYNEHSIVATANRNKKRARWRRVGFCCLGVGFLLQFIAAVC